MIHLIKHSALYYFGIAKFKAFYSVNVISDKMFSSAISKLEII